MKHSAVIFDFDGTIADSFNIFLIILNRLAQEMGFKAVAPEKIESFRSKTSQEVVHSLGIPFFKLPFVLQRARKEFGKMKSGKVISGKVISGISVVPGMKETLHRLKEQEVQLGLITSNAADNVQAFLKANEVDYFDFLSASSGLWGKARRIDKMISLYGLEREKVLYVGDETRDIEAAHKAGVRIAAVSWGYNNAEALSKFSPDYLLDAPEDLLSIVTK